VNQGISFYDHLSLESSNITLISSMVINNETLILFNSIISIDLNSKIIINCFSISNSTIVIDLNNISDYNNNITLIEFNSSCSSIDSNDIKFKNSNQSIYCPTIDESENSFTLIFQLCKNDENTDKSNEMDILIIILPIIGGVILLVALFLLISYLLPSIREKIFPHSKNSKKRIEEKAVLQQRSV